MEEEKKTKKEMKQEEIKELKDKQEQLMNEAVLSASKDDIHSALYVEMDNHIEMALRGISNGLLVEGDAGIGKTTRLMKRISMIGNGQPKFVAYANGFTTPAQIYVWLYEHRDYKNKVLDDVDGLLDNTKCLALLKGALWETGGKRIVTYNTSKPLEDSEGRYVELSYEEKGNIIILTNYINKTATKTRDHIKALISRVNHCEIHPTRKQLLEIIKQIARLEFKGLTMEERIEVYDYFEKNTNEGSVDVNIRTLLKMFDYKVLSKQKKNDELWQELSKKLLEGIDLGKFIKELHNDINLKDADIYKMVHEKTGVTKPTYYRIKQRLGLSVREGKKKEMQRERKRIEMETATQEQVPV